MIRRADVSLVLVLFSVGAVGCALGRNDVGTLERNQSVHIVMRDGVRIAIDLWLPPRLGVDDRVVAIAADRVREAWRQTADVS